MSTPPLPKRQPALNVTPALPAFHAITPARWARLAAALPLFREALTDAEEFHLDRWEFAIGFPEFTGSSLTGSDLRWLVSHTLLEHAFEQRTNNKDTRDFRKAPRRSVTDCSCFVLTTAGRAFAEALTQHRVEGGSQSASPRSSNVPSWNASTRELKLGGYLVKRFQTPARCQESILAAFEEAGWPKRTANPLQPSNGRHSRQRLHDAIRALNRNQKPLRVRFHGDGSGCGIQWSQPSVSV